MKDEKYYIELYNRYLNAESSVSEERELKAFLTQTDSPAFDEAKAVTGFFAFANSASHQTNSNFEHKERMDNNIKSNRHFVLSVSRKSVIRYAAAIILICGITLPALFPDSESYVSYADGRRTTDKSVVIDEMQNDMMLMLSTDDNIIEDEMDMMFR